MKAVSYSEVSEHLTTTRCRLWREDQLLIKDLLKNL